VNNHYGIQVGDEGYYYYRGSSSGGDWCAAGVVLSVDEKENKIKVYEREKTKERDGYNHKEEIHEFYVSTISHLRRSPRNGEEFHVKFAKTPKLPIMQRMWAAWNRLCDWCEAKQREVDGYCGNWGHEDYS